MAETSIEWTRGPNGEQGYTFNPWTGCTKVSPGCDHCYAEGWAKRSGLVQWGPGAERRRTSEAIWRKPLKWDRLAFAECGACGWRGDMREAHWGGTQCPSCREKEVKPARRRVFCASLSDVFDNEVPAQWRADLFDLIAATPNLDWLLVTKRIGNAKTMMADALHLNPAALSDGRIWPLPNVWIGATVTNQAEADRDIPKLLQTPAAVRFLSMEPLLGPVMIDTFLGEYPEDEDGAPYPGRLDWIIVGGESGPKARPMHPQWARDIRDQCAAAGVPFLFKQWGTWETCYQRSDGTPVFRQFDSHEQWVAKASSWVNGGICLDRNGKQMSRGADMAEARDAGNFPVTIMHKVGKKKAGRLLDGCEHNGSPEVTP